LITDICHSEALKNDMHNPEKIIMFVKFILHNLIESDFMLPNIEKKIIEKIINSSLDWVAMNINVIEETKCFGFC
jgi:hypothetical protein